MWIAQGAKFDTRYPSANEPIDVAGRRQFDDAAAIRAHAA
jgi:hypothetical protein